MVSTFLRPSPTPHFVFSGKSSAPPPSCVRFRPPPVSAAYASAERTRSTYLDPPKLSAPCASFYEVLGIPIGSTAQDIKAAYRRLARICHPDVAADHRKDSSADEFMRIHSAYLTLSDPEKRAVYDQKLFRQYRPIGAYAGISASPGKSRSGFSGFTRRNWETDQCW
ncbi:chaperone protein dnaJ 11, chloroplastic-like [Cornus florida]|uniref:chaperone protein dnaJ 11, chloroplastic-like n=1 Tax=Cornus florida TaxID=4283 RepID=UPI0028980CD5|nr:chaperone protein dnaJ 11, chloroplastic-like [Cornus florida]